LKRRPNVLWIMSDQHNANCMSFKGHPNVKTPNLDKIASNGVDFTHAFANNPICSPSRICFMTGQHVHTHLMYGNRNTDYPIANNDTIAYKFRQFGYQTALIGKSHMVRKWDSDGFEHIRYCDMIDSECGNPMSNHYFKYLYENGLADLYEDGTPKPGQEHTLDGSKPSCLPHEFSTEHFIGKETLDFLNNRDNSRPFFIHMSFQRPHEPITPSKEHFNMYNPDDVVLPDSAVDYFENRFAGKPQHMIDMLKDGCAYPLADPNSSRLKRCLASYYAIISAIDNEIGKVLEKLEDMGEADNTIIFYTADHGDFAGEHGLFHKNFGIYESIQRIPFILCYPNGPKGIKCDGLVESLDFYPTIFELCNIPMPKDRQGATLLPMVSKSSPCKEEIFCEYDWLEERIVALRTKQYRMVYYSENETGELYDRDVDPGEIKNLWNDLNYREIKIALLNKLLSFTLNNKGITSLKNDFAINKKREYDPVSLVHHKGRYWSRLEKAYNEKLAWPPKDL